MDLKSNMMLVLGVVFFVLAAYAVYWYVAPMLGKVNESPGGNALAKQAQELYLKSLEVGNGATDYSYAYEESRDSYVTRTTLVQAGDNKSAVIESPLATRELYYMSNDTLLCVTFEGERVCGPIMNTTESIVKDYMRAALGSYFFSDNKINKTEETANLLIARNALTFQSVEDATIDGRACKDIKFTIDYRNLTMTDLRALGISQDDPMKIDGEVCYDEKAGEVYSKKFAYNYLGKPRTTEFRLLSSNWSYAGRVEAPANLSGDAVGYLLSASDTQNIFITCLNNDDPQLRDQCVFSMAISNGYEQLCPYAGAKKDYCTLNFARSQENTTKCGTITNAAVKDDCYLEIAGRKKDAKLCDLLLNASRKTDCIGIVNSNESAGTLVVGSPPPQNESPSVPDNLTDAERDALGKIYGQIG
jgi:hypothetical protein